MLEIRLVESRRVPAKAIAIRFEEVLALPVRSVQASAESGKSEDLDSIWLDCSTFKLDHASRRSLALGEYDRQDGVEALLLALIEVFQRLVFGQSVT